jgi:hypothetical protein
VTGTRLMISAHEGHRSPYFRRQTFDVFQIPRIVVVGLATASM